MQSLPGTAAHFVLEALAYALGARVYWRAASSLPAPALPDRVLLLGITVFGAFLGSKLLHVAEHFEVLHAQAGWLPWLAGKSILGGLLGGTLGAELGKKLVGWRMPTGDPWVPALATGMIVGRIGCQLSGTWDQTYGTPTTLPWAWDYGDGIGRHPTALYEMLLLALLFLFTRHRAFAGHAGARYAAFLCGYCAVRLGLEFLKPPFGALAAGSLPVALHGGLTAIQWAAIGGMLWFAVLLRTRMTARERT